MMSFREYTFIKYLKERAHKGMALKDIDKVTDPSDWDGSRMPYLSQLDSLQRCFICKEFLQAPVVTSCNHTFCSKCIRQHLLNSSSCPLCKSEQYESNLRRVVVLEEIVNCFKELRSELLSYLGNERINQTTEPSSSSSPIKRKESDVIILSSSPVKKSKTEAECPICQKTMDSEFLQSVHIDSCLKGKCVLPQRQPHKVKGEGISSFFKSKPGKSNHIDRKEFYFNNPNQHIQTQNRLPKLDFNSLTTAKLKEKMVAVGLSLSGTRQQLELRYNQYYILFNANLDSNHPVDNRALKHQLHQWELSHLIFTSKNISSLFKAKSLSSKSMTDKDFSVKQWKQVYYQEFKELIQQAKDNINKGEIKQTIKPSSQDTKGTNDEIIPASQSSDIRIDLKSSLLFVGEDE